MSSNDISLSAAIRTSLISLQTTQTQVDSTQNALSTGLAVNNAVDNPVAYFQSQALTNRASDFSEKKSNIDQGISSLSTALEGINGIESLVQQLKGLTLNAESATASQTSGLVAQYNSLRGQVNTLAQDASYQGLNLIAGTGQTLNISFSTLTASNLTVKSVDVTNGPKGLALSTVVTANGGFAVDFYSNTGIALADLSAQTFLYASTASSLSAGIYTFNYGSATLSIAVASAGSITGSFTSTSQFVDGQTITLQFLGTGSVNSTIQNGNSIAVEYGSGESIIAVSSLLVVDFNALTSNYLASGTYTFSYAGQTVSFTVGSAGATLDTFTTTQTFSNGGPVTLTVAPTSSTGISASGLAQVSNFVGAIQNNNKFAVSNPATNAMINSGGTFVIDFQGLTGVGLNSGFYTFSYGGQELDFNVTSAGSLTGTFSTTAVFFNGAGVTLTLGAVGSAGANLFSANTVLQSTALNLGATASYLGGSLQNSGDFVVEYGANSAAIIATGNTIVVDFNGLTGSTLNSGTFTFNYGGLVLSFVVASAGGGLAGSGAFSNTATFANGLPVTFTLGSGGAANAYNVLGSSGTNITLNLSAQTIGVALNNLSGYTLFTPGQSVYSNTAGNLGVTVASGGTISVGQVTGQFVIASDLTNGINTLLTSLETSLGELQSQAQTVGSNVALLNTRLDFTNNYINLLSAGSGKLTLADLNQEGADLLSLQTRQQLGIQALSFAGQSEKAVLQLFR
jgi:flagellin-like hook-associated protein FlgL